MKELIATNQLIRSKILYEKCKEYGIEYDKSGLETFIEHIKEYKKLVGDPNVILKGLCLEDTDD
jgi:hypothetical protein